jgi:hypothetical protein
MKRIILFTLICAFLSCKGQTESKPNDANEIASFEFLSEEILKTKTKEELRLIRNEVFARKGYVFKSEELNIYFKTKSWYTPNANIKVTLSDKEQSYIDKVKNIETSNQKTDRCIHYVHENINKVYPLTGDNIESAKNVTLLSKINNFYNEKYYNIEGIMQMICDGAKIYNIDCHENIENLLITFYCNENPISYVITIEGNKVIKRIKVVDSSIRTSDEDSVTGGYHDIDFILDRDHLEVYKIFKIWDEENSTEENMYPVKEVRRELVAKYKLTDQGLVEQ